MSGFVILGLGWISGASIGFHYGLRIGRYVALGSKGDFFTPIERSAIPILIVSASVAAWVFLVILPLVSVVCNVIVRECGL